MPTYEICVVGDDGVQVLVTTDTAIEAIAKLAGAAEAHRRAWVKDQTGLDVTPDELIALASAERQGV